ncbi:protein arginine methyltransferase NDUFAF7, mitochondrial-like isoform X2 [Rhopilema esculentum]|uniref:protein arginine methyltransferase NDUFAF7, mitochondrial-like isoform X2 n=1 Tax=Rhopilema esculentum TaxID=499914 RepID=UPI0031E0B523
MFWHKASHLLRNAAQRNRHCFLSSKANSEFITYLKNRIKIAGPISVAAYMKEALTNPKWGYYMKKDVFGKSGDFITSPEISQMFGEMLGIWLLNEWLQAKQPQNVKLVELGPGRGTLMADILRVFRQFKVGRDALSVHLVEVSEKMRQMQRKLLCGIHESNKNFENATSKYNDVEVHWYSNIKDVPTGFTMYIAHEFFDALPIHVFKRTTNGWREVLVDADNAGLQLVVSPAANPLSELLIPKEAVIDEYEVCPTAGVTIEHMCGVIQTHGGSSLVVDYGKDGPSRNSLRSFKEHKLIEDIFKYPGDADITANVDFAFLKRMCHNKAVWASDAINVSESYGN